MVLLPSQAKLCDREPDNSVSIDRKPLPLHQDIEQRQGEPQAGVQCRPRTVAQFLEPAHRGQHPQHRLNGLITNDKFCLTRVAHVQQITRRARMPRRVATAPLSIYPSDVLTHLGGSDETPMAYLPHHDPASRWTTALGSGLSAPPPVGVDEPTGAGSQAGAGALPPRGGDPCE